MNTSKLALAACLTISLFCAGCDKSKPGNPMPPQKPPTPKTEKEKTMVKPVWQAPARPRPAQTI